MKGARKRQNGDWSQIAQIIKVQNIFKVVLFLTRMKNMSFVPFLRSAPAADGRWFPALLSLSPPSGAWALLLYPAFRVGLAGRDTRAQALVKTAPRSERPAAAALAPWQRRRHGAASLRRRRTLSLSPGSWRSRRVVPSLHLAAVPVCSPRLVVSIATRPLSTKRRQWSIRNPN